MHITAFNKFKRKSFRAVRLTKLFSVERKTVPTDPKDPVERKTVAAADSVHRKTVAVNLVVRETLAVDPVESKTEAVDPIEGKTEGADLVEHCTNKPIILLDVDGVINMFGINKLSWSDRKTTKVDDRTIQYSPTVVEKINSWNTVAEVRWLTWWDEKAPTMLAPALKLDKFPLARDPALDWSKLQTAESIAREVGRDHLMIWIDDELSVWTAHDRIKRDIFCCRKNTVLVSPKDGLRPEHLDFIDSILETPELTRPHTRCFEGEVYGY